jgi:hypothetical protein
MPAIEVLWFRIPGSRAWQGVLPLKVCLKKILCYRSLCNNLFDVFYMGGQHKALNKVFDQFMNSLLIESYLF